jgi:uridine kinase
MIGDRIEIRPEYLDISDKILHHLPEEYLKDSNAVCIAIGGESGCGKSTLSLALKKKLSQHNINSVVLHQDDYFFLPPKTNHNNRIKSISNVGVEEVNLELLDRHISIIKNRSSDILLKPLVNYQNDEILEERMSIDKANVVIVDGTYTMLLKEADFKIFMLRNFKETKEYRIARGRDIISSFNEEVLGIEHQIIKNHKDKAHYIIDKNMVLMPSSFSSS